MFAWPCDALGNYSARSTYNKLYQGLACFALAACIWKSWAPIKCKIFAWLAVQYKILTSNRWARHGLQDLPSPCYKCLQEEDNVDHILMHCGYAREVWHWSFDHFRLQVQRSTLQDTLPTLWTQVCTSFGRQDRCGFNYLVIIIVWSLWKQQNAWVVGRIEQQLQPRQLVLNIASELAIWKQAGASNLDRFLREQACVFWLVWVCDRVLDRILLDPLVNLIFPLL